MSPVWKQELRESKEKDFFFKKAKTLSFCVTSARLKKPIIKLGTFKLIEMISLRSQ